MAKSEKERVPPGEPFTEWLGERPEVLNVRTSAPGPRGACR